MTKIAIEPYKVYTTPEAADALGTSEVTIINEIKAGNLVGKEIGKGYKVLGENLLSFMSSPTIPTMKPNVDTSGAVPVTGFVDTSKPSGEAGIIADNFGAASVQKEKKQYSGGAPTGNEE